MMDGSFTSPIDAAPETVWALLKERVEHPEQFTEGLKEAKMLEQSPSGVLRELSFGARSWKERVTVEENEHRITYELVEHPTLEGDLVHQFLPREGGGVTVAFTLNYRYKNGATSNNAMDLGQAVQDSLLDLKNRAEEKGRVETAGLNDYHAASRLGTEPSASSSAPEQSQVKKDDNPQAHREQGLTAGITYPMDRNSDQNLAPGISYPSDSNQ
jgi:ribosome-associated toxin RatA of RatAB toxin-antitoxin module